MGNGFGQVGQMLYILGADLGPKCVLVYDCFGLKSCWFIGLVGSENQIAPRWGKAANFVKLSH